jgi:hypothetical protein
MTTNEIIAVGVVKATRARRAKPDGPTLAPAPSMPVSKSDTVIKLLLRAKGATPLELIAATDWQPHSVRAFLSGLRKKGRSIVREPRKTGPAAYRIAVAGNVGNEGPPSDAAAAPITASVGAA